MTEPKRIATLTGIAAPAVAFGAVLLSAVLSPTFTWGGSALSDMGAWGEPTAWLFNGGLIFGGLVGLAFLWPLWSDTDHLLEQIGTLFLGLGVLGMVLVGLFPLPSDTHTPVALVHFISYTVGLWVYGSGTVLTGRTAWGLVTIWLGIVHVLAWITWLFAFSADVLTGIALPEAVGSLIFAGWLAATARRLLEGGETGLSGEFVG